MNTFFLTVFGIIAILIIYVAINLMTQSLNDFLEKTIKKTVWLWLPFHALRRLLRELSEKNKSK